MINELYQNKTNRDNRAKELVKLGLIVKRYSVRNQALHPMYVKDYGLELTKEDIGFGNDIYDTMFSNLYGVKTEEV
jgi:hypothetical protein